MIRRQRKGFSGAAVSAAGEAAWGPFGIVDPCPLTTTRIRPMLAADVRRAAQVILDGGWGDRSPFFRWAVDYPTAHPLVADEDGRVVGTGVATANGSVGWVGAIFVDVERRGNGLGTALSAAVIEELERRGCTTQLLIATDEGRPIYERLGFAIQAGYVRLAAPEGPAPDVDGSVRPYEPRDMESIAALDARRRARTDRRCSGRSPTPRPAAWSAGRTGPSRIHGPLAVGRPGADRTDAGRGVRSSTGGGRRPMAGRSRSPCSREHRRSGPTRGAGWTEQRGGPRFIRGEALSGVRMDLRAVRPGRSVRSARSCSSRRA